jgi:hypothetical protein
MKFIREMMGKKTRSPEMGALPELNHFDPRLDLEQRSETAAQTDLPSIQARLQAALEKAEARGPRSERRVNSRQHVEDFRDVIRSKNKPVIQDPAFEQAADDTGQFEEVDTAALSDDSDEFLDEAVEPVEAANQSSDLEEAPQLEAKDLQEPTAAQAQDEEDPDAEDAYELPESLSRHVDPDEEDQSNLQETEPTDQLLRTAEIPRKPAEDRSVDQDELAKSVPSNVAALPFAEPQMVEVPPPAEGRSGRRAGRVKTRLLGFEHAHVADSDPFNQIGENANSPHGRFPVGWLIVLKGPGRGSSFELHSGVSQIGRGEGQAVRLDFGDSSISRSNHAAIAYDNEQRCFFIGHGGKTNLVRLNNKPVLSTEEINDGDLIRIGETVLRFVGLCGPDFDWEADENDDVSGAAFA